MSAPQHFLSRDRENDARNNASVCGLPGWSIVVMTYVLYYTVPTILVWHSTIMWKANIDTQVNISRKKDLNNSKIVLFLCNKILYFRAQVTNLKITFISLKAMHPMSILNNRDVACKQAHHLFLVWPEKHKENTTDQGDFSYPMTSSSGFQIPHTYFRFCLKISMH
jgi:hypothetical protein